MYVIIETGGKQYRVAAGDLLRVEVGPGMTANSTVRFDRVLLARDETGVTVGTTLVADAAVEGTVVRVDRAAKILVFKKKRRKQYRRTRGHRQPYAAVRIDALVFPGGKRHERPAAAEAVPKQKKAAPKKKAARAAGAVRRKTASARTTTPRKSAPAPTKGPGRAKKPARKI